MSGTYSFDKNTVRVLLELAVDNAVTNRMLMKFIVNKEFKSPNEIENFYFELIESQKNERKAMVENFYETFGDLPPGLL